MGVTSGDNAQFPGDSFATLIVEMNNPGDLPTIFKEWKLEVKMPEETEFYHTGVLIGTNQDATYFYGEDRKPVVLSWKDSYLPDVLRNTPIPAVEARLDL